MMRKFFILFFVVLYGNVQAQYPTDYFQSPLDIPLILSGTFGELRSTHFHAGLDFKTQQREGLKVFAVADGYVSRIKISHFGYGKALYITHPNGYTTVYGHLKKLAPSLEAYIKECQYDKESYEVEMFPSVNELPVTKGEVVAFSGNTGSSGGPHLHFEIRDNQERPINPMLFGFDIKDTKRPLVMGIYAYPKNDTSTINGKNKRKKLRLIPKKDGNFDVEKIKAYGDIGFGVVSYDQQDYAPNKNGVNAIETFLNGNRYLKVDFSRISFAESKHIRRYIDYAHYRKYKSRIQKLFIEKNNPLSIFKDAYDNGYIKVEDSTASVFKIDVKDFKQNKTSIKIPIEGKRTSLKPSKKTYNNKFLIAANAPTQLQKENITVDFYPNTTYDDVFIDVKVSSDTLFLHKDNIPLQKNFYITYNIKDYKSPYRNKLYVSKHYGYKKKPYYVNTKHKGDVITAKSKEFGTYALTLDTIPPKITPINIAHKKWMSKYRYLNIKIEDQGSGISKYRATVNGKWILMEYDYKKKMLTHDFNDNSVTDTKNNLKLIVTDNVGNSSTFEATFYRK